MRAKRRWLTGVNDMPLTIRNYRTIQRIRVVGTRANGWLVVRAKDGIRLVHKSELIKRV